MDLQERNKFIGGSECAAVLGLSRWGTPLSVWAVKTGQVEPEDISNKLYVKLGNKLEQTVADLFMEETGKKVHRVNETVFHQKHKFLGANIDRRVIGERAILECKTASAWKAKEWEGEEIPREYICQVHHYLLVTGLERAYLAVLIGNHDFKWKVIERDEQLLTDMKNKMVDFWINYVQKKVMPSSITYKDTDTLLKLFPESVEDEIELGDEANVMIENLGALEEDANLINNQIDGIKNELRAMLRESESGTTGLYKVTWKGGIQKRFSSKKLKEALPDLYEKYKMEIPSRTLRIKKLEQENGEYSASK